MAEVNPQQTPARAPARTDLSDPPIPTMDESQVAGRFQQMIDSGDIDRANDLTDAERAKIQGREPPQGSDDGQQAQPQDDGEPATGDDTGQTKPDGEGEGETDGKVYNSFDELVTEMGFDPESVKQLPVKMTIDGKEQDIPLREVIDGYNQSRVSQERMQRIAQERRDFDGEQQTVRQALGVRIQQTENLLRLAHQQLVGDFEQLNGPLGQQLNAENPQEFSRLWNLYQQRNQQIQGIMQQVAQSTQQDAQAQQQRRLQALEAGRANLLEARPEWKDPAKARAAQVAMHELGKKMGFTDAELGNIEDPRQLLVLDMAARYARLQAQNPSTLKRVRAAPKVVTKPGVRAVRDPKATAIQQAKERWSKSGNRDDDAAAALFEMLS